MQSDHNKTKKVEILNRNSKRSHFESKAAVPNHSHLGVREKTSGMREELANFTTGERYC